MGKKSLFQSTSDKQKKSGNDDKIKDENKPASSKKQADTKKSPKAKTAETKVKKKTAAPKKSTAKTNTKKDKKTAKPAPTLQKEAPKSAAEETSGADMPPAIQQTPATNTANDNRRFDSLDGDNSVKKFIWIAAACLAFFIFMVLIASSLNNGRYYIKQAKGAVEVWKGDFTPVGQNRIMILHGTSWDKKEKSSYKKAEVYDFASKFYVKKSLNILDDTGMQDHSIIAGYLEKAKSITAEDKNNHAAETLGKVIQYLHEASVLHSSTETTAQLIKKKRIEAARHAMSQMLMDKDN